MRCEKRYLPVFTHNNEVGLFKILPGKGNLASGKIPNGIFLQPGPRGFCLSRLTPSQTKTSLRASSPYAHQAVGALPTEYKNRLKRRFLYSTGEGT